jgi:hypothetical protein
VNRLDESRFERGQAQPTAVFNLVAPDERSAFQLVQVIENPFPRDIESWLRSLEFMRDHPYLLVSRFLSRTSRSLLEAAGVNYAVTGSFAAAVRAPVAPPSLLVCHVDAPTEVAEETGLLEATSRGSVYLLRSS